MRRSSFLKATAVGAAMAVVVAVLAATAAEAAGSYYYYIPTPATPDFFLSPIFLWVTANVIIVWLVSSSRRRGRAANDDAAASSAAHDGEGVVAVPGAVDSSFYASEYEAFSDAAPASGGRRASKKLTREARAAARRSDRPRVLKKREPAGQDAPATPWTTTTTVVAEGQGDEPARGDQRRGQGQKEDPETAPAVSVSSVATEPWRPGDGGGDEDEDVSMDSLWASIVRRRAARPVVVQKSESWGNEELPRLQRVAETARRQVRKSVSALAKAAAATGPATTTTQLQQPPPPPAPSPSAVRQQMGWRTRDVLVNISPDDLLRRAESFIRRQREHLRLQRQESVQRQLLLQRRLLAPAPGPGLIRAS